VCGEVDESFAAIDDDMIIEISDLDVELIGDRGADEIDEIDEPGELTRIIELVAEPN
jgi:hypothetical protein